ncbi:MAG TPA: S8 family peptidase [Gaiellaceae bacterium]|nr:S8 family peptidase [Gaiellaceae bacterium]
MVVLLAFTVSIIIPASGVASGGDHAAVPADLLAQAQANPSATFDVIVQGRREETSDRTTEEIKDSGGQLKKAFRSLNGAAATVTGKQLLKLADDSHVTVITRDDSVKLSAVDWRDVTNVNQLWGDGLLPAPQAPAIAIVDSGIDASRAADFGGRVVARANFSSIEPNSTGDPSGHGTMVAGIAAGGSSSYPGVAKNAPLVDVRVASRLGEARTSDIVAAIDWIIANKSRYNIRVANFSLAGSSEASFRFDPLDKAVEELWFSGVVVVAAAGNNGSASGPVKIAAPGNDPFIITVGALDTEGTIGRSDDTRAPWSAYGPTADGFMKPDLSAPGRYITAPVPSGSYLPDEKPWRVVSAGYMWMSGTSFSAPMVAGAAAQLLARKPYLTPNQVKGALMLSARYVPNADPGAGVGEVDAAAAAAVLSPPNPNENLMAFVSNGDFNASAWASFVSVNANWTQSNWVSSNWVSSNWVSSNWVASNWVSSNWVSSNWVSSNWVASNWVAGSDFE